MLGGVRVRCGCSVVLLAALSVTGAAQSGDTNDSYWSHWFDRSDKSKAEQPHWITPLATTTPRLEQEFRYDMLRQQIRSDQPGVTNFGAGKGLELIPFENVEVIAGVPAYLRRGGAGEDGFGDFRLLVKYRLFAANEERGNYILTAFADVSFPTGSAGNGQSNTILTSTLAYGKGWGDLDIQGTFAAAMPTGNEAQIGRTYTWNNALQYRLFRKLWPEVELNATWFQDGRNDGRRQLLVTPGLVVGRLSLTRRVGLTVGAGVQIAVSEFRTFNHSVVFSVRFPF
jgi:hypothetical protein